MITPAFQASAQLAQISRDAPRNNQLTGKLSFKQMMTLAEEGSPSWRGLVAMFNNVFCVAPLVSSGVEHIVLCNFCNRPIILQRSTLTHRASRWTRIELEGQLV
jgi:hypothetical protein